MHRKLVRLGISCRTKDELLGLHVVRHVRLERVEHLLVRDHAAPVVVQDSKGRARHVTEAEVEGHLLELALVERAGAVLVVELECLLQDGRAVDL